MAYEKTKKISNVEDLPFNAQAEQAVIGSAMLSRDALYSVLSSLKEEDFFLAKNQIIYRAMKNINAKKIEVDVLTMTEELMNMKELENVGGVDYLRTCTDSMVALSSLDFYIGIVSDQSCLRSLLLAVRGIDERYKTEEIDNIGNFIVESEEKIKNATEKQRISSFKKIDEVTEKVALDINAVHSDNECTGLTTGYKSIDSLTAGFQKGEVTILAARPSVGKTALALNFAFKAATLAHAPVAFFSLEMNSDLLVKRLIASASTISLKDINLGRVKASERQALNDAIKKVSNAPIYIDDSPGIKLMDIINKSRKLQAKLQAQQKELGLICIDYLGLINVSDSAKNPDARHEAVRKISAALKDLARELKVPILVLCQLSRDVEKRDNKKPMISDLRDSGSIEQDADVIMLLYREDYYKGYKNTASSNKKPKDMSVSERGELNKEISQQQLLEQMPGDASYVEVIVAKNRNGQTGSPHLFFYKAFGKFEMPPEEFERAMRNFQYDVND